MRHTGDDKAQSIMVGLIIALGILVLAVSTVQFVQVPMEEELKETDHLNTVDSQFFDVRQSIMESSYKGITTSTGVDMGVTYEGGFIMDSFFPKINSPNPEGAVIVENFNNNIELEGDITNPIIGEINDISYESSYLIYEMDYNHIRDNPNKYYENSFLFDEFAPPGGENEYVVRTEQSIIQGDKINIPVLQGQFVGAGTRTVSIQVIPVSSPRGEPRVMEFNSDVTLTLPTNLPQSQWESLLSDEANADVANHDGSTVEISIDPGVYEVSTSKVVITDQPSYDKPSVVDVMLYPDQITVQPGETKSVRIRGKAYDEYYNFVSGEKIRIEDNVSGGDGSEGSFVDNDTKPTNSERYADFLYSIENTHDNETKIVNFNGTIVE